MTVTWHDGPSDYSLINRTQEFFSLARSGRVTDPTLIAAWREFHQTYDPIIRCCIASFGIWGELLEDATQSAWLLVLRDLRRFDCDPSKGSFRAWLFARVRNVSVDQVRQVERSRERCAGSDFTEFQADEPEPAQVFERQWDKAVLHDALKLLSQHVSDFDYELFVMRRLHEQTVAELVNATGLSEAAVRSKLHRAMMILKRIINDQGYRELLFQCD